MSNRDSKTLGEELNTNFFLEPGMGWVHRCPNCGTDTNSLYKDEDYLGSECRECNLLWKLSMKGKVYTIVGTPHAPQEATRTYEIAVVYRPYYLKAATAEGARKALIRKLGLRGSDRYGILVEYLGDNAECNEGLC